MILDHRIAGHARRSVRQRLIRLVELALFVQRPPEAVLEGRIGRLDLQRALQQVDRFVEPLATIGEHVAE